MYKSIIIVSFFLFAGCAAKKEKGLDEDVLTSMGQSIKTSFIQVANDFEAKVNEDVTDHAALIGLAETNILLYIFGYMSRSETIPGAMEAFQKASSLDSLSSNIHALSGMLSMLNWNWNDAKKELIKAIRIDPGNLNARHWYSLYLSAMGRFDEAMAQSDTIGSMDPAGNYLIGRGSLFYFARRNREMKELMLGVVEKDPLTAWGYDWLGMAYVELEEYDNSIDTYYKAFEFSDGTVEVGAGLGHALGLAGKYDLARQMADYYAKATRNQYVPPVQRSFIHIGIGEYDEAIRLLEQAYTEQSWFLIFIQVEPWYDPIRQDRRFDEIIARMGFMESYGQ